MRGKGETYRRGAERQRNVRSLYLGASAVIHSSSFTFTFLPRHFPLCSHPTGDV